MTRIRRPVRPLSPPISLDGDPLHESRIYAMMHVAIHDALNAIDRQSRPYTFDMQAEPSASPDAAVAWVAGPAFRGSEIDDCVASCIAGAFIAAIRVKTDERMSVPVA